MKALLARHTLDVVITDDGLQHYALARDIELVVIDGMRRFGNGWWLPAGPMRERESRLASVDAVIVNGGTPRTNEIGMTLTAGMAVNLLSGESRPLSLLRDVVAMAGIGHPRVFLLRCVMRASVLCVKSLLPIINRTSQNSLNR